MFRCIQKTVPTRQCASDSPLVVYLQHRCSSDLSHISLSRHWTCLIVSVTRRTPATHLFSALHLRVLSSLKTSTPSPIGSAAAHIFRLLSLPSPYLACKDCCSNGQFQHSSSCSRRLPRHTHRSAAKAKAYNCSLSDLCPPLLSLKTIECTCQILCAGPRPFSAPQSGEIWRIQR